MVHMGIRKAVVVKSMFAMDVCCFGPTLLERSKKQL